MILINNTSKKFGLSSSIFKNEFCLSYNIFGNFLIDGFIGPIGATAIDSSKSVALIKAYHETIERQSLMIGGFPSNYDSHQKKVAAFNLITNKIEEINLEKTKYINSGDNFSDTTGTAVNLESQSTIYKAVTELLEKNILFLFWYGNSGLELSDALYRELDETKPFIVNKYKIRVFLIKNFNVFFTVITIVIENNTVVSTGIAGDINYHEALKSSLREAHILLWQNSFLYQQNQSKTLVTHSIYSHQVEKLLDSKPLIKNISLSNNNSHSNDKLDRLVNNLPKWIKTLYIVLLQTRHGGKSILCYSNELYNSLPRNSTINLNRAINKSTLNIKTDFLDNIPDCIVL